MLGIEREWVGNQEKMRVGDWEMDWLREPQPAAKSDNLSKFLQLSSELYQEARDEPQGNLVR